MTLALGLLVCVSTSAAKRVRKSKKKAQVEKVDTIPMADFSYAFGVAQTTGLQSYLVQRMGVDEAYMADFLKGFDKVTLEEADKREKARLAGIEIRQQVENQIIPHANRQINDSTDLLNRARFIEGFRAAIAGNATLTNDSAQAVSAKQMDYYNSVKMEAKYGQNRRDECIGWNDDFIARAEAVRADDEVERIEPVCDAHGPRRAAVGGEVTGEALVLLALQIPSPVENGLYPRVDLVAEAVVYVF